VLITPGNPSGVTIPPAEIAAFATLARRRDIALILDEAYQSFRDTREPAHPLFADPASGARRPRLPGRFRRRPPELNREVLKLIDCVAICSPRVGQEAALAGLTQAGAWRRTRVAEIAQRRAWLCEA